MNPRTYRVGVISDTHGLLRPQAVAALQGSDLIIHAGDVGSRQVLEVLREVAPVYAVRGNVDRTERVGVLPRTQTVQAGAVWLYVLHDLQDLDIDPAAAGFQAVISGHSHKPAVEWREEILFLNPGSAGPRRFKLPVSIACLQIQAGTIDVQLIELEAE